MLTVWLVLIVAMPGHEAEAVRIGMLRDAKTCAVAGRGMQLVLEAATPGLAVDWVCLPAGEPA